jgi:hypothetical protein
MIGELTVQNEIVKKASGLMRKERPHEMGGTGTPVVSASRPLLEKPGSQSGCRIARGTLYFKGKQAGKDKAVATAIEQWHEQDDTMGHRKLAVLLKTGKNRVKRVMK